MNLIIYPIYGKRYIFENDYRYIKIVSKNLLISLLTNSSLSLIRISTNEELIADNINKIVIIKKEEYEEQLIRVRQSLENAGIV